MSNQRFVKVWRIQNSEGVGVFNAGGRNAAMRVLFDRFRDYADRRAVDRHDPSTHPAPSREMFDVAPLNDLHHVRFGCASLRQMTVWFTPKFRAALADCNLGFRLVCYRVPADKVCQRDMQVTFDRRYAQMIENRQVDFERLDASIAKVNKGMLAVVADMLAEARRTTAKALA